MSGRLEKGSLREPTKRERRRLISWFGLAAKILIVPAVGALGVVAFHYGRSSLDLGSDFRLAVIEYEGARNFNTEAFNTLLLRTFGRDLLSLDPNRVRALVESETWVRHALVRRKLPDSLRIHLTERVPLAVAAIDNDLFVVDDQGVILDVYGPRHKHLDGPIVKGLGNPARENAAADNAHRIRVYLRLIEDLGTPPRDHTKTVSEVDVTDPSRVAVVPSDEPVAVYLGAEGFRQRYETFLSQKDLYLRLKQKYGLIEYVDVTYDNKIIFHTANRVVSG